MDYITTEQYDMGISIVDRLIDNCKHPDLRAFHLFVKSNIYHRKGDWPQKISTLSHCLEIKKTDNPLAECNLGTAYLATKNYSFAKKHLLKAIELAKGNYPLAICYLE
jgi:tetratricopeptide (TPR) repeat protein